MKVCRLEKKIILVILNLKNDSLSQFQFFKFLCRLVYDSSFVTIRLNDRSINILSIKINNPLKKYSRKEHHPHFNFLNAFL